MAANPEFPNKDNSIILRVDKLKEKLKEKYIDSAITVIDNQFGTQFTPVPSQDGNGVSSQSGINTTTSNSDSTNSKNSNCEFLTLYPTHPISG